MIRPKQIDLTAPSEKQIRQVKRNIDQLWEQIIKLTAEINNSNVNIDNNTDSIEGIMREINA